MSFLRNGAEYEQEMSVKRNENISSMDGLANGYNNIPFAAHLDKKPEEMPFSSDANEARETLEEVEALVLELYKPGTSERIAGVQKQLQAFQRSPEGWFIADHLLGSPHQTVRFFGALTITVKLNQERPMSNEDQRKLLAKLIWHLIVWVRSPGNSLGIRKMCSTLVAFWMHFPETWESPIRHLAHCLYYDEPNPDVNAIAPINADMMRAMDIQKNVALLWFSNFLVEEVCKADQSNIKNHHFHERLQINAEDVVQLVSIGICDDATDMALRQHCMMCFQSWVTYSHKAFIDAAIVLNPLKALLKPAMNCLQLEDLFQPTAELFTDLLENHTSFLSEDELNMILYILVSPWAEQYNQQLRDGNFDFDSRAFGYLLLAFAGAIIPELARNCGDPSSAPGILLSNLITLLTCKGYAAVDDKFFVPTLEFWTSFVEWVLEALYTDEDKYWLDNARKHIMKVIELCWHKIQYPNDDDWNEFDSAEKTEFNDARRDVADLLQCSYTLTGTALLASLASSVLPSLENRAWHELEASLFCLATLADCIAAADNCYDSEWSAILGSIINSELFPILSDSANPAPKIVRIACLLFVSRYADHFQRHPQYIAATLAFLFQTIEFPTVARKAAQTVQTLCSTCRLLLVPQLDAFMQHCGNLVQTTDLDTVVKGKIIGSIATIIQALPTEEAKIEPVELLLQFIDQDVNACLLAASQSNVEEANTAGTAAIRGLLSIAKGLQVPADVPVDLEQDTNQSRIWIDGAGSLVQRHITALIQSIMNTLIGSTEVIDIACHVFRAGFSETEPGPFKFSADTITQFILRGNLQTPRPDLFISTACSFINSFRQRYRIDSHAATILHWLVGILQASEDVDIAASGIHYFNALMPDYINILLHSLASQGTEFIFMFTLKTLSGKEPIPRAVACDFWTTFLTISDHLDFANLDPALKPSLDNTTAQLGPFLAEALINNIGGNCPRSGIDKICEPLRKLVVRQVNSKRWLEAALHKQTFPSNKASESEKRVFLQKVTNLRGAKGTNQVVMQFWLLCRGLN